jgi:hypothetical protein
MFSFECARWSWTFVRSLTGRCPDLSPDTLTITRRPSRRLGSLPALAQRRTVFSDFSKISWASVTVTHRFFLGHRDTSITRQVDDGQARAGVSAEETRQTGE